MIEEFFGVSSMFKILEVEILLECVEKDPRDRKIGVDGVVDETYGGKTT